MESCQLLDNPPSIITIILQIKERIVITLIHSTNLTYNIMHSPYINIPGLFQQNIQFNAGDSLVYLLGNKYNTSHKQEFINHFQNTIWFSYRKNIPGIGNDTGWGCMIRSVMMMIAEALKRTSDYDFTEILKLFEKKGKYSFVSICHAGDIINRWTSSNQILSICESISLKQQNSRLYIKNISSDYIVFDNIEREINKLNSKTLIIVQTKLGLDSLDLNYVPYLKKIMKLKQFCGMLGGSPGKAMFIIGFQDQKIIGLDPHYVQDESSQQQYYFKQFPRGLGFNKLNSSISIGFYLSDIQDYYHLITSLLQIQQIIHEHRAIGIILNEADKIKINTYKQSLNQNQNNIIRQQNRRKQSEDDFQIIE